MEVQSFGKTLVHCQNLFNRLKHIIQNMKYKNDEFINSVLRSKFEKNKTDNLKRFQRNIFNG